MKYNFDKIQEAEYCCDMCFLESVLEECEKLDPNNYESVAIIAKDGLAKNLFRRLSDARVCGEYLFDFGIVDYDNLEYQGEYIISISYDGVLFLERMVTDAGAYLYSEGKVIFIHEDCNYKAVERLNDGENNIVIFGLEE